MKQPNKFGYFIKNNNYFLQIINYTSKFIMGIPKNKY